MSIIKAEVVIFYFVEQFRFFRFMALLAAMDGD